MEFEQNQENHHVSKKWRYLLVKVWAYQNTSEQNTKRCICGGAPPPNANELKLAMQGFLTL